jgi:hypothetical protein
MWLDVACLPCVVWFGEVVASVFKYNGVALWISTFINTHKLSECFRFRTGELFRVGVTERFPGLFGL